MENNRSGASLLFFVLVYLTLIIILGVRVYTGATETFGTMHVKTVDELLDGNR